MQQTIWSLLALGVVAVTGYGFGGSEEKFIKKYAMMKVYESCFGLQVLKEVRREMKEAARKCASAPIQDDEENYVSHEPTESSMEQQYTLAMTTERTTRPARPVTTRKPIHTADTLLLQQWTEEQNKLDHVPEGESPNDDADDETDTAQPPTRKPLDLSKLEEAILNINRPGNQLGLGHQRPGYAPPAASPGGYYPPMYYPPPMPYPPAYPYSPYYPGYYQPPAAPPAGAPYSPASSHYSPYYSRSGYRSAKITKGFNKDQVVAADNTVAQISGNGRPRKVAGDNLPGISNRLAKNDYNPQQSVSRHGKTGEEQSAQTVAPGGAPRTLVPPKDLDVKMSIDSMTYHSGAKLRNITCVMQELGYLDSRLEPNYDKMVERIANLQVAQELKQDMVDGVKFCRQFSQCVPEVRKDKFQLSKELLRPMFFFRCYKHKKLEACIMKDVRDRFASSTSSSGFEDSSMMANELRRSFSPRKDLANAVFEFMYGPAAEGFDGL